MTLAILCSGQGGQHAAMFDLTAGVPQAQSIFAVATELMGGDPRQRVRAIAQAELFVNSTAQLLCCTQALAAWTALDLSGPEWDELLLAGYSVGELAAWGCAGLIGPPDVLRLAQRRAWAMDEAAGLDSGLASVRGISRPLLSQFAQAHRCEIAIVLGSDSFIVGGLRSDLRSLCEQLMSRGARRCALLPIGVAAHTSLLAAASDTFAGLLRASHLAMRVPPRIRLLSGVDGDAVLQVSAGVEKLALQISHTLDWHACLTACREAGVTRVLELGPGRALANMAREAVPEARCRSLEDFKSIQGVRAWLNDS